MQRSMCYSLSSLVFIATILALSVSDLQINYQLTKSKSVINFAKALGNKVHARKDRKLMMTDEVNSAQESPSEDGDGNDNKENDDIFVFVFVFCLWVLQ